MNNVETTKSISNWHPAVFVFMLYNGRILNMSNLKRYTLYILNVIDLISCILTYFIAFFIRTAFFADFYKGTDDYGFFLLTVAVAYFVVNFLMLYKDDSFLRRNSLHELIVSLKMSVFTMAIVFTYFNFAKVNANYSRLFEVIYLVTLVFVDFALRVLAKKVINSERYYESNSSKVLLLSSAMNAAYYSEKINNAADWRFKIEKIAVTNKGYKEKEINGISVVTKKDEIFSDDTLDSIDGVIIIPGAEKKETVQKWMEEFRAYGKTVHIQIPEYEITHSFRSLDNIGDVAIVTYREIEPMSIRQRILKRLEDIAISIVALPIFVLLYAFAKLLSEIGSSGSALVKRVRVGRNNRRFYQYRFRIYSPNADLNIRNGKSPYTVFGRFLTITHLDGLPQILNVLIGDMSIVGPKAPNLPRYIEMSAKERNLLTTKPGIVGYWTAEPDYAKAFQDEQNYLQNWSIFKDFVVIGYCVLRYVSFRSLRIHGETHIKEELFFANQYLNNEQTINYDRKLYTIKENVLYSISKRLIDILASFAGIVVFSPVLLLLTAMVIADDGGQPFYAHERIGKNGKKIRIYKFRSMRQDAGNLEELLSAEQLEQYKREFKIDNDPRITKIGSFIRKTSLDELPQLFNILFGDMSIVGPRPLVEDEIYQNYLELEIAKLLSVKPGLTGYWQAYARNNAEYGTHERQDMELYYIDHRSLLFDIRIFFKTIVSVVKKEGAK